MPSPPNLNSWYRSPLPLVAVWAGNKIEFLSNPNIFSSEPYWELGWLSIPISVLWIVGITNA